ncbi:hypothetical protein OIU91_04010 [Streptomyces sp. NBC_01456]|uniref:hypothetical protein n=1 Tax=unclassified Streptomyces TaxID=2593676 RepID=UPI002E30C4EB|nr:MULTISPECIES: hypothetical protein [unclassified Streptomyces]
MATDRTYYSGPHLMCGFCDLPREVLTAETALSYPDLGEAHEMGSPLCCDRAADAWRAARRTAIRVDRVATGWRVHWREGDRRRARTWNSRDSRRVAVEFAQYIAKGGAA